MTLEESYRDTNLTSDTPSGISQGTQQRSNDEMEFGGEGGGGGGGIAHPGRVSLMETLAGAQAASVTGQPPKSGTRPSLQGRQGDASELPLSRSLQMLPEPPGWCVSQEPKRPHASPEPAGAIWDLCGSGRVRYMRDVVTKR